VGNVTASVSSAVRKDTSVVNDKVFSIFLVSGEHERADLLRHNLSQEGYICSVTSNVQDAIEEINEKTPDLLVVEGINIPAIRMLCQTVRQEKNRPIIALIDPQELHGLRDYLNLVNDFAVLPLNMSEIGLRVARLLGKSETVDNKDIIRCGDLTIDTAKYEVFVGNTPVALTFTEYELLKFLVTNKGRVFSRETLLNKIWGYDYYGGDRTVDVHIKRLRSKIEISDHLFIDTIRNIGYKFRDQ
jgi:two-component system alkaline phosphatase synthesis response regulator PhoP